MTDDLTLGDLPQPVEDTTVPPDALSTDGDNPNEMTDEQFGLLCDRMADNGWLGGPVITDADGLIADGEHRWRAAQEIGLAEVPVRSYDIDDATRRLWRQELNKIHGEHDRKRDALEYDALLDAGFTEEVTALCEAAGEDLDELLAELRMDSGRRANYDYDPEHNVHFEDCVEGMRERLADDSVDCVITDPPYGIDAHARSDEIDPNPRIQGDGDVTEALTLLEQALPGIERALKPTGALFLFTRWDVYPDVVPLVRRHFRIRNCIVWDKDHFGLGEGGRGYRPQHEFIIYAHYDREQGGDPPAIEKTEGDLIRHRRDTETYDHVTQKPVPVVEKYLLDTTQPGETVLDPFMGSGTTAVAAIQNDRDYVGFEIDAENYREVIERRIGEAKRQREASVNQEAASADD